MTLLNIGYISEVLTSKSIDLIVPVSNGAFFSPLILLKESLTRLPRECLHLFQRTVTLRFRQQTAGQDQAQQRQTAQIELQRKERKRIQN